MAKRKKRKHMTPAEKRELRRLAEAHLHTEEGLGFGSKLREAVFGFNDGLVSTFAIVVGVTGAMLASKVIVLTGLANLVAGAFSMGLGSYLSLKSENEYYDKKLAEERAEIKRVPHIEREEIRILYMRKGFKGKLLDQIVKKITSNEELWLEVMMEDEFGLSNKGHTNPKFLGLIMGCSFIVGAIIPIVPFFFFDVAQGALQITILVSLLGLFFAGIIKSFFAKEHWLKVGLEMVAVGGIAATATFFIGEFFVGLV